MAIKLLQSVYDEVSNKTKFYLEDVTEDILNIFQEVVTGNVTDKTDEEQLKIALDVHYARYYADKATNEFLDALQEKSKKLDELLSRSGELTKKLEQQIAESATAQVTLLEIVTQLTLKGIINIDKMGNAVSELGED